MVLHGFGAYAIEEGSSTKVLGATSCSFVGIYLHTETDLRQAKNFASNIVKSFDSVSKNAFLQRALQGQGRYLLLAIKLYKGTQRNCQQPAELCWSFLFVFFFSAKLSSVVMP